jgi:hypothetical protein
VKIIALTAENIKKLTAVEIRPDGNMVQITGANGSGKTSVLDSIWWAIAGTKNVQRAPINKGAEKAVIKLDLGDLIITRRFNRQESGEFTTSLAVENAEGAKYPSPQTVIDKLIGSLAMDPLAFARAEPRAQFETLRRFVTGFDFAEHERVQKEDYEARTAANRRAKEAEARAAQFSLPDDVPAEPIDEDALLEQLNEAQKHNGEIEVRKVRREGVAADIERTRAAAVDSRNRAAELRRQADDCDAEAVAHDKTAADLQAKLDAAGKLPDPIDVSAVRAELDAARTTNALVQQRRSRDGYLAEAESAKAQSEALTAGMQARDAAKMKAIAEAALPIEGVGFGDGFVMLNGVPFDQASDAEQLRASCAIAMAGNPKLRVLRIRDGSLLDDGGLAAIAEMADANDYQVWIERVDTSGAVGFVLEDGHLRAAQLEAAE